MDPMNEHSVYEVIWARLFGSSTEIIRTMNVEDNTSVGTSTDLLG